MNRVSDGSELEAATRRDLKRSRGVVFAAFLINAGLNFVLLGILARLGGLEMVGQWAFLNAVLSVVLIADFGATNALTYRIGRDGIEATAGLLRLLLLAAATFIAACLALIGLDSVTALLNSTAALLTIVAGFLQLASNWMISIRMGQHEQYWFNVKTVLRVSTQTGLALALLSILPEQPMLAFGLALALAALIETLFAAFMVHRMWTPCGSVARTQALRDLLQGFGLLALAQRGLLPLSQLIVSALAGATVLGIFTVASRAPIVISQSVSEALRALLPGLAGMTSEADRPRIIKLLADGITGQIVLIYPALAVLSIHAHTVFTVWLGESSVVLEAALMMLSAGVFVACLTVPHFWALQAMEAVVPLSRLTFWRVLVTLVIGALLTSLLRDPLVMPATYSASLALGAVAVLALSEVRLEIVWPCLKLLRWRRIAYFCIFVLGLNSGLATLDAYLEPDTLLGVVALGNLVTIGPLALYIIRKRAFTNP